LEYYIKQQWYLQSESAHQNLIQNYNAFKNWQIVPGYDLIYVSTENMLDQTVKILLDPPVSVDTSGINQLT
jgi:hypothetical protein